MEQSVAVSSSHIVRQGTFATDSSKTLRSKSGAIKKGSISLPVIDDKTVGIPHVEYKGDSVEIVKKRKKPSEKPPVKTSDHHQSESKGNIVSPHGIKSKSKDVVQTKQGNIPQNSYDNNTEGKDNQQKATKSSKHYNSGKGDVVADTPQRNNSIRHPSKDVKGNDKEIVNEKVQNNLTSKPNSRVKESVKVHGPGEQDKKQPSFKLESIPHDKNGTSRNASIEKNNSVENLKTEWKGKSPQIEESGIRVIGHIEAPSDSRSSQNPGNTTISNAEKVNIEKSRVKAEKGEAKDSKKGNKKQKSPHAGTRYVDDDDKSSDLNVKRQENKTDSVNNLPKTEKGEPSKKRFTKASDLLEDTNDTHTNDVSPYPNTDKCESGTLKNTFPERKSQKREYNDRTRNKTQENKPLDYELYTLNTANLDPVVPVDGVVNKPPQSTILATRENTAIVGKHSLFDNKVPADLYTQNSQGDPVAPVTHQSKDSETSSKMESDNEQEYSLQTVKESYDSVYAERKSLLEAEVTYKKRIRQLENEMNQFVRTVENLRTENKTIRTTMERMEEEQKKKESHQSKNTVVIIADEDTSDKSPSPQSKNTVDAEKDDLKRQIEILKKENKTLDDKVHELNGKTEELKTNNQKLDEEVTVLRKRLRDLEKRPPSKRNEKSTADSNAGSANDLNEKSQSSENELSQAKLTEHSLREEINALKVTEERHKKEAEELLSDKKKLEYELGKLKDAVKEDKELAKDGSTTARDKMELKSHVVSLQTDNQNLNEENMKLKAECLDQVRKIHELEKAEKTEVEKWKTKNEEMKREMKKLQEEKRGESGGNTKKLEAENKALSEALSQKKMELDELMHALNGDNIEDEVQKIKAEKEHIQKELEESQKKVELTEKVVKELEEIKTEKVSLQQKLEISEKKIVENDQRNDEINELKAEKEKLQKQLDENEKRVLESADSLVIIHELRSDKEKLQKQVEENKTRESDIEKSLTEVKIQRDALETEKKNIKEELEETVKTNKNLQKEMEALKSSQEAMSQALDEEKSKITLLAEKEWELDELRKKCDLLEKELSRTKQLHGVEIDKINDEKRKEENKLRKELENATERKNETIEKLTKKMLSMESTKNMEIKTLKEQIEALVVDKEIVEKTKVTEKENKELRQELKTVYNKYSELVIDLGQKKNTEERAFEMSMRVEQMSVKMKLMEKEEREWRVKKEQFDEIEASNKRLMEESIALKKMLEEKGKGPDDISHRLEFLERRQTDSDTRVKQLEGWVGDLYIESDRSEKGRNKNATKQKNKQNSKTIQNPSKLSVQNQRARSLEDVEVHVDDKTTESSTPTLPSIYANSTGQMTFRSMGYSQIHKARMQKSVKKRR